MKHLIIALIILSLCPPAFPKDGDLGNRAKHFTAGAIIGGTLSHICKNALKSKYFCAGFGTVSGVFAGALFEMVQEDYTDAGGDIMTTSSGALFGSVIGVYIEF